MKKLLLVIALAIPTVVPLRTVAHVQTVTAVTDDPDDGNINATVAVGNQGILLASSDINTAIGFSASGHTFEGSIATGRWASNTRRLSAGVVCNLASTSFSGVVDSASATFIVIGFLEYSGGATTNCIDDFTVDADTYQSGSGGLDHDSPPATSRSMTVSSASMLINMLSGNAGGGACSTIANGGETVRYSCVHDDGVHIVTVEDKRVTSNSTTSFTWTGVQRWGALALSIKEASAGGANVRGAINNGKGGLFQQPYRPMKLVQSKFWVRKR